MSYLMTFHLLRKYILEIVKHKYFPNLQYLADYLASKFSWYCSSVISRNIPTTQVQVVSEAPTWVINYNNDISR